MLKYEANDRVGCGTTDRTLGGFGAPRSPYILRDSLRPALRSCYLTSYVVRGDVGICTSDVTSDVVLP